MNFQQHFYKVGYQMEKNASRFSSTVAGAIPNPLLGSVGAGLVADEGKGIQTAAGSFAGMIGGSALAGALSSMIEKNPDALWSTGGPWYTLPLAALGGGIGAYLAHGEDAEENTTPWYKNPIVPLSAALTAMVAKNSLTNDLETLKELSQRV